MHKTEHYSPMAMTYAEALLELAVEETGADIQGQAREVGQELLDLAGILEKEPSARTLLTDPAISRDERGELVKRAFEGRVSPLLMKFLNVLNQKGRLGSLAGIAGAFDELLDQRLGNVEVDVTVARKLDAAALENVRVKVGAALKREAVVHQYVDEGIIGGLILRYQDKLIDGSVRTQLSQMREQILSGGPK